MFGYQLKIAWKSLKRSPVLSTLLVVGIGLGIAVSTAFVTTYYLIAQDPIPGKSDRLFHVQMDAWNPDSPWDDDRPEEPPNQLTWTDVWGVLGSDIPTAETAGFKANLTVHPEGERRPFRALARLCLADFFPMFEVPFAYGGPWDESADRGGETVVVLDHETNLKLFGGEDSVGRSVRIEDRTFTVTGVLAPWRPSTKFYDLNNSPFEAPEAMFLPFSLTEPMEIVSAGNDSGWKFYPGNEFSDFLASEQVWLQMWVQLDSPEQVAAYRAHLDAWAEEQRSVGRFQRPLNNRLRTVTEWMAVEEVMPDEAKTLLVVGLLFLVVCSVNLIGILLGKFLARAPEVGVRRALGASRASVFLQHVIECELIGVLGGVAGSRALGRCARRHQSAVRRSGQLRSRREHGRRGALPVARRRPHRRDLPVVADLPRRPGHLPEDPVARDGAKENPMHFGPIFRALMHHKARFLLVTLEVALTLAIVVNCVNMMVEMRGKYVRETGIDEEHIIVVQTEPFTPEFQDEDYVHEVRRADLEALGRRAGRPGGRRDGAGSALRRPVARPVASRSVPRWSPRRRPTSSYRVAWSTPWASRSSPGRDFAEADFEYEEDEDGNAVHRPVIVSQALADKFFPDGDALGKTIQNEEGQITNPIVGITRRMPNSWPEWDEGREVVSPLSGQAGRRAPDAVSRPCRAGRGRRGLRPPRAADAAHQRRPPGDRRTDGGRQGRHLRRPAGGDQDALDRHRSVGARDLARHRRSDRLHGRRAPPSDRYPPGFSAPRGATSSATSSSRTG